MALSRYIVFALIAYAVLSLTIDLKVLFFSGNYLVGGKFNKYLLFMALGFLMFMNIMVLHQIAKPLGNAE
jgi:hypothetical protein